MKRAFLQLDKILRGECTRQEALEEGELAVRILPLGGVV